ncbi:hypothetical protein [Petrimonas sp.]|uniref:hypothetical protein n=1 Tax=Petrimonas sp. TaxID=2023866 RepID=UPI003F51622D
MTAHKLSNLQLELLKIYSFNVKDEQLLEIKNILGNYFADKVTEDIDKLFDVKGWGLEKIQEWSEEHMRVSAKDKQ